jgi:hypothetical protein
MWTVKFGEEGLKATDATKNTLKDAWLKISKTVKEIPILDCPKS